MHNHRPGDKRTHESAVRRTVRGRVRGHRRGNLAFNISHRNRDLDAPNRWHALC